MRKDPRIFQYKPGELSIPPSDRATLSNISKQFSKTIIFCRIGLFSATFISSNKVVFRSNSFEDDKQSTFIRFISRSEAILGDFCLGQSDARARNPWFEPNPNEETPVGLSWITCWIIFGYSRAKAFNKRSDAHFTLNSDLSFYGFSDWRFLDRSLRNVWFESGT